MRLIDDWKHAWKFHTVIGAALLGAANALVANLDAIGQALQCPEVMAAIGDTVSPAVMHKVNVWVPVVLIALRLRKQAIPAREPDKRP